MMGDALCPSLTLRFEVLRALRGARRSFEQGGAPAGRPLGGPEQVWVRGALARASARAAWPLPGWFARLRSPAPQAELEDHLVTAAAAVHRLSPHRVAFAVAVELLDVVAVLDRPSESVEVARRG